MKTKIKLFDKIKNDKKRIGTMALGASVLGFAFIGVITVIVMITNLFISVFDDTEEKQMFEKIITPVVMVDPVEFSDIKNADEHTLLMSSMWNILINLGENAPYNTDEYGMMKIPSSDLDVSAANLFGNSISLSHQPFGDSNISFEFDTESSSYIVPSRGFSVQYRPRVEEIDSWGDTYTLTVSYILSNSNLSEEEVVPDKQMLYILKEIDDDKYIITAIENIENENASSIPNEAPTSSKNETSSDSASSSIAKPETEETTSSGTSSKTSSGTSSSTSSKTSSNTSSKTSSKTSSNTSSNTSSKKK